MLRRLQITVLFLLVAGAIACEGSPPGQESEETAAVAARPDFGPTAAYGRRLIFLGPGDRLPTAAIFDFTTFSDSAGVERGARARLEDGSGWARLMDAGWTMAPMRDPWRLVPHGPLKLLVTEGGELGAVEVRDDEHIRLEPGPTLAENSPDAGTQLVLRRASLAVDDDTMDGVLLDAQLGRTLRPDQRPADPAGDTAAPANPTPVAQPGAEALLLDNTGYYAVFTSAAGTDLAWVHNAGRDDLRRGARLEPTDWDDFPAAGVQMPTAWRITAPDAELDGKLTVEDADREALAGTPGATALGYAVVSGWIEDRGVRRAVFGLVRYVR